MTVGRAIIVALACLHFARPVIANDVHLAEDARIALIERLSKAVVCIFDQRRGGGGSGVLITEDGLGLTNYHVVAGMLHTRKGLGGLADGKLYELHVLGIDITGDVAMFRLTGRDRFDFVELGNSDDVRVGDETLALGNPFILADDYTPTITRGIVSGIHRFQEGVDSSKLVYSDCIQIDTSINPGNSGGPLFDANGRLIGINGRIAVQERGRVNVGLGFAIPINQIERFMPAMAAGKLAQHGTMDATVYDAPDGRVIIDRMFEDGPAWNAGLRIGDAVISVDGEPIGSANRFLGLIGTYPAEWTLPVVYDREGQRKETSVTLAPLPVELPRALREADEPEAQDDEEQSAEIASSAPAPAVVAFDGPLPTTQPSATERSATPLIDQLSRRVVRLYGAAIGREPGYASGVLVSPDGLVVTAMSLLIESPNVFAVTGDGRRFRATVTRRDTDRQLALLQLEPEDPASETMRFDCFHLGGDSSLDLGDTVFAAANPFRIAEGPEAVSITRGIFSGRRPLFARRGTQPFPYRGEALLIDAITNNPGSPGGALVDREGRLVGVLGRRVRSTLTNTNVNYATPVEIVAECIAEAQSGVDDASPTPDAKPYHGIKLFDLGYNRKLVYVETVRPNSPASKAGLRPDDLIMSLNGQPIAGASQFTREIDQLRPGDTVTLGVKRGDRLESVEFTLEAAP